MADVGGQRLRIRTELARPRVTLRLDGRLIHVVCDNILARTLPSPIAADQRRKLRGARIAPDALPPPPPDALSASPLDWIFVDRRALGKPADDGSDPEGKDR